MEMSVVVASREEDRNADEALAVATVAERLGFGEAWIGEGPTWDGFVLATGIGHVTERISLTVGPVPVSVRDPASIARAAAGVATLTGRRVGVALGTSSRRVVEGFHGRSRDKAANALYDTAEAVRRLMHTGSPEETEVFRGGGFSRRLRAPGGPLTVAAFGDRAIAAAAAHADRMVLDLVSPDQVRELRVKLEAAAGSVNRVPPRLAAWLPVAVEPGPDALRQLQKSVVGYLAVPGYSDMFRLAGLGSAVDQARAGVGGDELLDLVPASAAREIGLVGDAEAVRGRLDRYQRAGLDEVAVVPMTAGDDGGERTLTALSDLRADL